MSSDEDKGEIRPRQIVKYHGALSIFKYEGDRNIANEMHGQGHCIYAGGAVYTGSFQCDLLHGFGKMLGSDGSIYEGEWFNDARHGFATFTYVGGRYEGNYRMNKRHGRGKEIDSRGNTFEGDYVDGDAFKGKMVYDNGDIYVGEFNKDGDRHGQGKFISCETGELQDGTWVDDVFQET